MLFTAETLVFLFLLEHEKVIFWHLHYSRWKIILFWESAAKEIVTKSWNLDLMYWKTFFFGVLGIFN